MKDRVTRRISLRIAIVGAVFLLLLTGLLARAVQVQVLQGPNLSRKAANEYERSLTIRGKRGTIFASNNKELAVSIAASSVCAYPSQIRNIDFTAGKLAKILRLSRSRVKKRLESGKKFVWIKRHATPKEKLALKSLDLPGIDFIPEYRRLYPNKQLAAQALGFCGVDERGLEGLEFVYDDQLKGRTTELRILKDALGRGFNSKDLDTRAISGNDIVLTIDATIQFITEQELEKRVKLHKARSGIAVVMSPKTGAVLALANYPYFNPNSFLNYDQNRWRNRAVTDSFEPGSVMKVFTAAAALETGKLNTRSKIFCENGKYRVGNRVIHDHKPYKWLSLLEVVKYSSNIGAAKLNESIGNRRLYRTLKMFGFGDRTGIDLPGETPGSLSYYPTWTPIDSANIAFGQGISTSAIQLASAFSTIANNGIMMRPYVVQVISNPSGKPVRLISPQKVRQAISYRTAMDMKRIMSTITEESSTGRFAAIKGFKVCGKTGTAQKIDETGEYAKGKYTAVFAGFVPFSDPQLTIVVIIDEPQKEYYGGIVAAPAFRQIGLNALQYLNIHPEYTGSHLTADSLVEMES